VLPNKEGKKSSCQTKEEGDVKIGAAIPAQIVDPVLQKYTL